MLKILFKFLAVVLILLGAYVVYNSQRTFEVKFKNIDGLPVGASVTSLGVKIGEVVRTRPVHDGIIVSVRVTNKHLKKIEPGSELTITSFRPNQGRVIELIPPSKELRDKRGFLVQEPITTESWLYASLEIFDNVKSFSRAVIKYVTPENFQKARKSFQLASESLTETALNLARHEKKLTDIGDMLNLGATETNELLLNLQKPIGALNKIISDKNFRTSFKDELNELSSNLFKISSTISGKDFLTDLTSYKIMILDYLNNINASLTTIDTRVKNNQLKQKIKTFNQHLTNLNYLYGMISKEDVQEIRTAAKKAQEVTMKAKELTDELVTEQNK